MEWYVAFIDQYLGNILAVGSIVLCGLIVCGIVCIPFYLFKKSQRKHLQLRDRGKRARGTVVGLYHKTIRMRGDENTPTVWMKQDCADYSFVTDEGETFSGSFAQNKKQWYRRGEKITVYYSPHDPSENCTHRHLEEDIRTNRFFVLFFSFIMAVSLIFAFWMAFTL